MKYTVTGYRRGKRVRQKEVHTTSFKKAAEILNAEPFRFDTLRVATDKKVWRLDNHLKIAKTPERFFKQIALGHPAILVMAGSCAEFHLYKTQEERDATFEEVMCITSTSAESVKSDPEPTDTTVSSEETNASKSGSTSRKTLSGSVVSAMILEKLTRMSIGKSFGSVSAVGTEPDTWSTGSKTYHSKPKGNILAKVKRLPHPDNAPWPGTNWSMKALERKTILVRQSGKHYYGESYIWLPEWLELLEPETQKHVLTATVKRTSDMTHANGVTFVSYMRAYIGKTISVKMVKEGVYEDVDNGWSYSKEWLIFDVDPNGGRSE